MMNSDDDIVADWTLAYDGSWGRLNVSGERAYWVVIPTPTGERASITCRVCGAVVTLKKGDVIRSGDPRLCVHL